MATHFGKSPFQQIRDWLFREDVPRGPDATKGMLTKSLRLVSRGLVSLRTRTEIETSKDQELSVIQSVPESLQKMRPVFKFLKKRFVESLLFLPGNPLA